MVATETMVVTIAVGRKIGEEPMDSGLWADLRDCLRWMFNPSHANLISVSEGRDVWGEDCLLVVGEWASDKLGFLRWMLSVIAKVWKQNAVALTVSPKAEFIGPDGGSVDWNPGEPEGSESFLMFDHGDGAG